MLIPAGHKFRLRSTTDAKAYEAGLTPIAVQRNGREIVFLEDAEIVPKRKRQTATPNA